MVACDSVMLHPLKSFWLICVYGVLHLFSTVYELHRYLTCIDCAIFDEAVCHYAAKVASIPHVFEREWICVSLH